jgi:hypothetical protein
MIESIKKDIYLNCIVREHSSTTIDIELLFKILDKYNNQPAIKSESEIYEDFCKERGILTLKQINDNQPDYKTAWEELKNFINIDFVEIYKREIDSEIEELEQKHNIK